MVEEIKKHLYCSLITVCCIGLVILMALSSYKDSQKYKHGLEVERIEILKEWTK